MNKIITFLLLVWCNYSIAQTPLTNTFTYQGELKFNNTLADGAFDFEFNVFDVETGGTVLETVLVEDVIVTNGVFTTPITLTNDLFTGNKIWLDIGVREGISTGAFDVLSPRQEVTSAPYAIHAQFVDLNSIPSWNIGGNVTSGADFIGTTNNVPFNVKVNNQSVMTLFDAQDPIGPLSAPNVILGPNSIIAMATLPYGSSIGGGRNNTIESDYAVIGGGSNNSITGDNAVVSGGGNNQAIGFDSTIGGGQGNKTTGSESTISGGQNNIASSIYSTVPGGNGNKAGGTGSFAAGLGAVVRDSSASGDSNGDEGTFIWADASNLSPFSSTGANQFLIRAAGGVGIGINNPNGHQLNVLGSSYFRNSTDTSTGADLILGGSTGNATDDGVLTSDLNIAGSDLFIKSNDAVLIFVDANEDGDIGNFKVRTTSGTTLFEVLETGVVNVPGSLNVTGSISKGSGSFKIDHPLDPKNKYLYHSFVESPDMMNVYNGNIITNKKGEAWVELPNWFEALNRDFRYQLTVIGSFARAMVAQEISNNQFLIKTDEPNIKVSWQITGIRHDAYAEKNRIEVEVDKPKSEIGSYLYPEAWQQ